MLLLSLLIVAHKRMSRWNFSLKSLFLFVCAFCFNPKGRLTLQWLICNFKKEWNSSSLIYYSSFFGYLLFYLSLKWGFAFTCQLESFVKIILCYHQFLNRFFNFMTRPSCELLHQCAEITHMLQWVNVIWCCSMFMFNKRWSPLGCCSCLCLIGFNLLVSFCVAVRRSNV